MRTYKLEVRTNAVRAHINGGGCKQAIYSGPDITDEKMVKWTADHLKSKYDLEWDGEFCGEFGEHL